MTYAMFATSKHLSVGTFAILSIMIYSTITRLEGKYVDIELKSMNLNGTLGFSGLSGNGSISIEQHVLEHVKLKIATTLAFWCGVFQVNLIIIILLYLICIILLILFY
jgi:MFS superfamily sulfate permease-like transporter